MILRRINRLYEQSKKVIATADTRSTENFMAESEIIDETRREIDAIIDEINAISLTLDATSDPDYDSLETFDDLYTHIKRMRNNINSAKTINIPAATSLPVPTNMNIKLPPVEIPSFDGKTENWSIFYESFRTNIHENPHLSDAQRVQYLVGKLTQNALKVTAGIMPTSETYKIIWNGLVKKYQDKRALGTYYLSNILDLKNATPSASSLNAFIETFSASIAALKQLDIEDITDFILLHCALKKVDAQTVQSFELSVRNTDIPSCNEFIAFVQDQVKILERSANNNCAYTPRNHANQSQKLEPTWRTYKTFLAGETVNLCLMCHSEDHMIFNCNQFKNLGSPQSRFDFIKAKNACVNCLSSTHMISNCNSKYVCHHCQRKHHTLLHFNKNDAFNSNNNIAPVQLHTYTQEGASNTTPSVQTLNSQASIVQPYDNVFTGASLALSSHIAQAADSSNVSTPGATVSLIAHSKPRNTILLSTAQAHAYDKKENRKLIRLLLDNGSQNNLITLECCKSLNLPITPLYNSSLKGVGLTSRPIHGQVYLTVESRVSAHKYYIDALVVDNITDKLPEREIDLTGVNFGNEVPLADPTWYVPGAIDLVLGAQLFPYIYLGNRIDTNSSTPPAFLTTFGYILMGDVPATTLGLEPERFAPFTAFTMSELNSTPHKFWELEEIPTKLFVSQKEVKCESSFTKSVARDDEDRYSVELSFCRDPENLGNSRAMAQRHYITLELKFKHSPEFIIVLNVSSKTHTGLSLNDVIHTEPNLLANFILMPLDFRLFSVALTVDIKPMYLQIDTPESHRKYLKILFRVNENEELSNERVNLSDRKQLLDFLVNLYTLQVRQRWCTPSSSVTIGTVGLIDQDDVPPLRWPMVFKQVYPGSDGVAVGYH